MDFREVSREEIPRRSPSKFQLAGAHFFLDFYTRFSACVNARSLTVSLSVTLVHKHSKIHPSPLITSTNKPHRAYPKIQKPPVRGTASPISGFCATSARQFALGLVSPQAVRFRCAEDGAPYAAPRLKPRPVHRFAWTALTGGTAPSPQRQKAGKPKLKLTRKKNAKHPQGALTSCCATLQRALRGLRMTNKEKNANAGQSFLH